jgi:hypothetical protein
VMMANTRPSKVQCKFCGLQLIYHKDKMLSHLGYRPQRGGKGGVGICAKVGPQVKTLFARCGGNSLPHWMMPKHSATFPILSMTGHWVLSILLLRAPK